MFEVPDALTLLVALVSLVVVLVLRLREQGPAAVERATREATRLGDERDALAVELKALTERTGEARAVLRSAHDEAVPEVARLEQLRASTTAARDALDALETELARLRADRAELAAAPTTGAPAAPKHPASIDLATVAAAIGAGADAAEPALAGRIGATRATEALPEGAGELAVDDEGGQR